MHNHQGEKQVLSPLLYWIKEQCGWIENFGEYLCFCFDIIKASCHKRPSFKLCLRQLYDIGVASLPVVIITGFFTGMVLAAQAVYQLSDKGLSSVTGLLVAKAMITELGPVLTAFMVTGRVGAAICAELGTMHVTEQIDALETMAISPKQYLVAPRLIAGTVAMPLLTIFSMVTGILGGCLIASTFFHIPPSSYFDPMPMQITLFDLLTGVIKSLIFGLLIMTIGCFKGMKASGGAAGVGKAITSSVVITYCSILLTNFFLTLSLNIFYTQFQKGL
ncbi:MlaE family ABC transporter permease [Rhabdochlamydiaceae symbiont of Dictyostelium giganteum]|uniref:MlaE family ABC transporter permease n=1 Tax=Rhabdochlamydiaceae symbiont of Dictyostelium giganteum TaxID=3342349 RepID=UPI00384F2D50